MSILVNDISEKGLILLSHIILQQGASVETVKFC